MIHFENVTKRQLLTICLHEDCSLFDKYEAARELQMRWSPEMIADVVRLYGRGYSAIDISEHLGVKVTTITNVIRNYRIRRVKKDEHE